MTTRTNEQRGRKYRKLRRRFLALHPYCQACRARGITMPSAELDHVMPVHVAPERYWSRDNWQALCIECHKTKTKADGAALVTGSERAWADALGDL